MSTSPGQIVILILKIVGLVVILMVLSGIGSTMLPGTGGGTQPASPDATDAGTAAAAAVPSGGFMALILAVMGLQVLALAWLILRSKWRGWCLVATVFVVHFGTGTFLNQIESLVYLGGKLPQGFVAGLFVMGLLTAALFAPIAVAVLGRWRSTPPESWETGRPRPGFGGLSWRVAVAGAIYLALYYLFGYFVAWQSPELRDYYGGSDPGSFLAQMGGIVRSVSWMLPVQFARGLGWAGLGLLVIRSMRGSWWEKGLATAVLFAVPCFYLLLPNPFMPEAVTRLHFVETLPYQLGFGFVLGWLYER